VSRVNIIHLIYIGVHPHKHIGHEDNVQTGGVVRVVVGLRSQFCTLLEVSISVVQRHHTHYSVESVVERGATAPSVSSVRGRGRQGVDT
jgi:hypothetical protein